MTTGFSFRAGIWLAIFCVNLLLLPLRIDAAELQFFGGTSWHLSDDDQSVILRGYKLKNMDPLGSSDTVRHELWAYSSLNPPHQALRMASHTIGMLQGGEYRALVDSGYIPVVKPAPGVWYWTLELREYFDGTGSFTNHNGGSFPFRVAGGAFRGDVQISAPSSCEVVNDSIEFRAKYFRNACMLGTTGRLRIDAWATKKPYTNGPLTGYRLGSVEMNGMRSRLVYTNLVRTARYSPPPDGRYYVTMGISEFHSPSGQYRLISHVSYPELRTFGNPPPPPPPIPIAPTLVSATKYSLATGVRLTWTASPYAVSYDVYRSTSYPVTTSTLLRANLRQLTFLDTSAEVGVTYFYWVRARNISGRSAFSNRQFGTRKGLAPAIVTQTKNVNRFLGQDATLSVSAIGTPPLFFQWTKDGVEIDGATNSILQLTNLAPSDVGSYRVEIIGDYGIALSANVSVKVYDKATVVPFYWQRPDRRLALSYLQGTQFAFSTVVGNGRLLPPGWEVRAFGDLNRDSNSDIILQHTDGRLSAWFMDGVNITATGPMLRVATGWNVVGATRVDSDDQADLLLHHTSGRLEAWRLDGTNQVERLPVLGGNVVDPAFRFVGVGDFNADGYADIVWHHRNGRVFVWLMLGTELKSKVMLRNGTPTSMRLASIVDMDKDGDPDLIWQADDQRAYWWKMDQFHCVESVLLNKGRLPARDWKLIGPR